MIWKVVWSTACERAVLHMPPAVAERLCAAVYTFAQTGAGQVERVLAGDPWFLRLRTADGAALFRMVPSKLTIEVELVYRGR